MARKQYLGVENAARSIRAQYMGVENVARKVVKSYLGVNDVARLFWEEGGGPLAAALYVGPAYGTSTFYLWADATGGKPPYLYQYSMSRNNGTYVTVGISGMKPTYSLSNTGNFKFRVKVTDSEGTAREVDAGYILYREPSDLALNLTLNASLSPETGIATWNIASTSPGGKLMSIQILKDGLYYQSVAGATSISLLLTEPGIYTAVAGMVMSTESAGRTVTGGQIVI